MGEAAYDVWPVVRLAPVVGLLAAYNTGASSRNKLDTRTRINFHSGKFEIILFIYNENNKACQNVLEYEYNS